MCRTPGYSRPLEGGICLLPDIERFVVNLVEFDAFSEQEHPDGIALASCVIPRCRALKTVSGSVLEITIPSFTANLQQAQRTSADKPPVPGEPALAWRFHCLYHHITVLKYDAQEELVVTSNLRGKATLLRMLGHPVRLAIVSELAAGPKCVTDIQELLGFSRRTSRNT